MKYRLKNFDEYLLAKDSSVRDLGWTMVYNFFNIETMNLKDLVMLKLELSNKKYYPMIGVPKPSWYKPEYYKNSWSDALKLSIIFELNKYGNHEKHSEFSLAKQILRREGK